MSSTIPGPRFKAWAALRFAVDPYAFFRACKQRYGDPFVFRLGADRLVVTGEPEHARTIFGLDPDATAAFGPELLAPILGKHSLIILSGPKHRRERKLLMPAFHGSRMRSYATIIREVALERASAWKIGQPFVMQRTTQAISLDIILRAVFGLTDPERRPTFEHAMVETLDTLHPSFLFLPALQRNLGPLTTWRRFDRALTRSDALLAEELNLRRNQPQGSDILSMILAARDEDGNGLDDDEIVSELKTLLVAGHETTAITLAWAFYWLLRTPAVMARLRDELTAAGPEPEAEAIAALPYLDAVCHEVLRHWPILPIVPRKLLRPLVLGPHTLDVGMSVAVATTLIHEHPSLYPDPQAFHPERFLERKFSPFEFVPFGGGNRRCIGAAFAMYELKLTLAALVPRFTLRLVNSEAVRPHRRNISLGPKGGVQVVRVA